MAKSYQMIDHAADIGIEAHADTLQELLEALAEGMIQVICPPSTVRPSASRTVAVAAEDAEATAVDFLGAVLRLIQMEHFMVAKVTVGQASPTAVSAEVTGEPYDPARHEIAREIKAVTYHELLIALQRGRWHGRVICDL